MCLVLGQASCLHYPTDSPLSVVHLNTSDFCPPVKCLNFFQHSYTLFCYSGATCNQWNMEGPNIISSTSSTVAFSGSGSVVFGRSSEVSLPNEYLANLCLPLPVSVGFTECYPNSAVWTGGNSSLAGSTPPSSHTPWRWRPAKGRRLEPEENHCGGCSARAAALLVLELELVQSWFCLWGNRTMCPWGFFLLCGRQAWLSHFLSESSAIFKTKIKTKPTLFCLNSPQLVSSAGN